MKLLRYGDRGRERPGVLDSNGKIRDLYDSFTDITRSTFTPDFQNSLTEIDVEKLPIVEGNPRLGPPVASVGKLVCIGLNYRKHAEEAGLAIPEEPIIFMKATSSIVGPNDDVMIPKDSVKTDWEVELAVIIGSTACNVEESHALEYVAGYCVANDVSERAFQIEGTGQWVKGKSADTFCPLGPYLVTPDEVPDPQNLRLWLEVEGNRYQDSCTDDMIFDVPFLISYVSRFMTLLPADVLLTGTPSGVGFGMKPPVFLKPGDRMELGVEGLGVQSQTVVDYRKGDRGTHYYD